MISNFAPLRLSCWYSSLVKDGVLRQRGIQALCAEECFLLFLVRLYSHGVSVLAIKDLCSVYPNRQSVKTLEVSHNCHQCLLCF